mmetsp:Transcript_8252/g.30495  ORF Transcript_8252/g.30495 Transcript_8252/m.30495 type:complete len:200 (-) Transcript_8252:4281-4880(-)
MTTQTSLHPSSQRQMPTRPMYPTPHQTRTHPKRMTLHPTTITFHLPPHTTPKKMRVKHVLNAPTQMMTPLTTITPNDEALTLSLRDEPKLSLLRLLFHHSKKMHPHHHHFSPMWSTVCPNCSKKWNSPEQKKRQLKQLRQPKRPLKGPPILPPPHHKISNQTKHQSTLWMRANQSICTKHSFLSETLLPCSLKTELLVA